MFTQVIHPGVASISHINLPFLTWQVLHAHTNTRTHTHPLFHVLSLTRRALHEHRLSPFLTQRVLYAQCTHASPMHGVASYACKNRSLPPSSNPGLVLLTLSNHPTRQIEGNESLHTPHSGHSSHVYLSSLRHDKLMDAGPRCWTSSERSVTTKARSSENREPRPWDHTGAG